MLTHALSGIGRPVTAGRVTMICRRGGASGRRLARLPARLVYVMGAEGEGMSPALAAACDLRLSIPGTGAVESLNVAAATAVLLAAWRSRGSV